MKQCNKCLKTKSFSEFFKDKNNVTDGRYSICKECKQANAMLWRVKNKARYNETMRKYHKKHYSRLRLLRYDLTPEAYAKMLHDQKGVCAICNQPPKKTKPLVVDHCHKTDKVRGLLCYKCNRDMVVVDDVEHMERLILHRDKKAA